MNASKFSLTYSLCMALMGACSHKSNKSPPSSAGGDAGGVVAAGGSVNPPAGCVPIDFSGVKLAARGPYIVRPGDKIAIAGEGLRAQMYLQWGSAYATLDFTEKSVVSVVIPKGLPPGSVTATLMDSCATGLLLANSGLPVAFYIDEAANDAPIFTGDASALCSGVSFYGSSGALQVGTKDCSTAPTPSGPPASPTPSTPDIADCASDGEVGCKTNANFRAADMTAAVAANIRGGVSVAGTVGIFPSAAAPLPGAGSAAKGSLPKVDSTVTAGTYEYWSAAGEHGTLQLSSPWTGPIIPGNSDQSFNASSTLYLPFTVAGSPSLKPENIEKDSTIFGVVGTAAASPADCNADGQLSCVTNAAFPAAKIEPGMASHIRTGKTYAGIVGHLKFCRNAARLLALPVETQVPNAPFVDISDGNVDDQGTPFHLGLDPYDTIDDRNGWVNGRDVGGAPPDMPWGPDYRCAESDWRLLAADGKTGGDPSLNCVTTNASCMIQDPYSQLVWSQANPGGNTLSWAQAAAACLALDVGTVTSGWRLPTQKESMQAYIDGVTRLGDKFPQFDNPSINLEYWTATSPAVPFESDSTNRNYAWAIRNGVGNLAIYPKFDQTILKSWRCVHDPL